MKIFDCFTFFNELDILEIRLAEMYPVVDKFVLVEANVTHNNEPKRFLFEENKSRYSKYLDKIIYIKVTDMPRDASNAWVRENYQRNAIIRGLDGASDADVVIISDLDEIPRRETISELRGRNFDVCGLRLRLFSMRLNYMNIAGREAHIVWPVISRKSAMKSPQDSRNGIHLLESSKEALIIDDAGWHYTSVGNDDSLLNKIQSFAHQEFNNARFLSTLNIEDIILNELDLFGRREYIWSIVPLSMNCPHILRENPERFHQLTYPESPDILEKAFRKLYLTGVAAGRQSRPRNLVEKVLFKALAR